MADRQPAPIPSPPAERSGGIASDVPGSVPRPDPTNLTTEALRRDINASEAVSDERFQAIKNAIKVEKKHAREVAELNGRIIDLQFALRDTAAEKLAAADQKAIAAALQAAKEQVAQSNSFQTLLVDKMEAAFTKSIDAIGAVIKSNSETLTSNINGLKERLDRGDGRTIGTSDQRTDSRSNVGMLVGIVGAIVGVVGAIAVIATMAINAFR